MTRERRSLFTRKKSAKALCGSVLKSTEFASNFPFVQIHCHPRELLPCLILTPGVRHLVIWLQQTIPSFSSMFVLVLLQIFGYFSICYAQCNISQQEYLGLESFFYASNGPFWTIPNKESAWTFPAQLSEPCNQPWAGLTCMMQGFDCVVTELTLNGFSLRGSISSDLTMLQGLVVLDLGNNDLNSTIPDVLNQFSGLKVILLNDNDLTGTVPMLPKSVEQFVLNNNNLGGHLDVFCSWGVYSNITVVDIASNDFSGTISSCFHDSVFPQIQTLAFGQNHISGSLPDELFSLTSLLTLDVSYNMLDGGLSGLRDLAQLTTLEAWNNLFTGSYLSSTTGNYWISLLLYKNYLSGTLSSSLSNSNNSLRALNVGYNFMSGTLPSTLSILLRMETFNITHNSFHGQISQLFPDTANVTFPLLNAIDLSDNYFTGTLPDGVFDDHPFLTTVVIYNNCMHGSLPSAICEADVLTALVLDGITTRVCHRVQQAVLRLVSNGGLEGEIPSCIWQMPSLEVLHLSGNGLVGNLGDILKTSALVDVSLSNNLLAGTIPYSWQTYGKFKSLLLSSNRIHGTLSPDFAFLDSSDIQLAINRLSGTIPQSLMNVQDINILNGNSFQCMAGQLPKNDPKAKGYVCGSDNLDAALVLTFGGVGCLLLLTAVALYRKFAILTKVLSNYHLFDSVLLGEYQKRSALLQVYNFNGYIRRFLWVASVFGLVVCMPWYVALKLQPEWSEKYSFHTFNYAWIISPAYLRGLVPTWLVTLQIAIVGYMFSTYFGDGLAAVTGFASINQDSKCASISNWPAEACKAFVLIVFHCVVMFVINAAYIYAVVEEVSTGALTAVQIALNAMKLGWEFLFVQWSLENTNISSKEKLMMSAFMSLFTFIISPLLVTFFTDPRCFEYTVTGVPSLSLTYQTPPYVCSLQCDDDANSVCSTKLIFTPSLILSFQHGSIRINAALH